MAISDDFSKEELEIPPMEDLPEPTDITPPSNQPELELVISLNAFTEFSSPQTIELISYIKNQKVIILINS